VDELTQQFVLWGTVLAAAGGVVRLLVEWDEYPGHQRFIGALLLSPFVGLVASLTLFPEVTPETRPRFLATVAMCGFFAESLIRGFGEIVTDTIWRNTILRWLFAEKRRGKR
jgi:hypothetical protein